MKDRPSLFGVFALAAAVLVHAPAARGASPFASGEEACEKEKLLSYDVWNGRRVGNAEQQKAAYAAGKRLLAACGGGTDDPYVNIVRRWVTRYEEAVVKYEARRRFEQAVTAFDAQPARRKDYASLFAAGKEYLAAEPENLYVLLVLTNAGYMNSIASVSSDRSLDADAVSYARRALRLVEAGKATPADFKLLGAADKEDAVAGLDYRLGIINSRSGSPDEAVNHLLKVAQSNNQLRSDPTLYYYLAQSYTAGEHRRLANDYKARFEGREETAESRRAQALITASLNRILDAYARSVAFNVRTDPASVAFRDSVTAMLTRLYTQSHGGSDAGLAELISGSATRRLPLPTDPVP